MNHAVGHFHACGKIIYKDAPCFAFDDGDQGFRLLHIGIVHMNCAGQLTLYGLGDLKHLTEILSNDDNAKRPKDLFLQ